MQNGALVLVNSTTTTGTTSDAATLQHGMQGVLVVDAGSFAAGTTMDLEFQGYSQQWIRMNTSTIAANTVMPFSLPAGQYRMNVGSGSVVGLSAVLSPTP